MKNLNTILVTILLIAVVGCGRGKQSTDDIITVDVTKNYPKKELIIQDFMDVEYIPLETSSEFICQGLVLSVGKKYLLVRNRTNDGIIFIFDRNGKGIRTINRRGQGAEEYMWIYDVLLDEDNDEIFVNVSENKKILVYDLFGNFKRVIRHKDGVRFDNIHNFDKQNFILWNSLYAFEEKAGEPSSFYIVSKQDGSIIKKIEIPYKERISPLKFNYDKATDTNYSVSIRTNPIIHYQNQWILVEPSSDTIYFYLPDYSLKPFMVRSPSIQSMNPEVFLFPGVITDRYCFMNIYTKDYDFYSRSGTPVKYLMYDRRERSTFGYVVFNADYSTRKEVYMTDRIVNDDIASWQIIEADELFEDYEKGILKGRLKEIAAGLKEEDNPVIMLIKHKK